MYVQNFTNDADRTLLEKLYRENRQSYYFIARKILPDDREAEQAVYTGLCILAGAIGMFRNQESKNLAVLAGITIKYTARRAAAQHMDIQQAVTEHPPIQQNNIKAALLLLSEEERDILLLHFALHLDEKRIGILMQMPEEYIGAIIQNKPK